MSPVARDLGCVSPVWAGVAIVFGCVVLGVERGQEAGTGGGTRSLDDSMSAPAGAFCIFAVVVGIYAMTQK